MTNNLRVKICGICSPDTAASAAEAGADALGLVFFAASPRNLSDLSLAREITDAVGPFVSTVGLFVNPTEAQLNRILEQVPLGLLQFHGEEDDAFCRSFRRPFIKALRMRPGLDVTVEIQSYPSACGILLDAYRPGIPGGTGATFDWSQIPPKLAKPLVLAGGLTVENVADAVSQTKPWAVDVSGGVETAPGTKSLELVNEFIRRAKGR